MLPMFKNVSLYMYPLHCSFFVCLFHFLPQTFTVNIDEGKFHSFLLLCILLSQSQGSKDNIGLKQICAMHCLSFSSRISPCSRAIEQVVVFSDLAHQQFCLLNTDIDFSHPGMRRSSTPPALLPKSFQCAHRQWWLKMKAQGIRIGREIVSSLLYIQSFFH